MGNQLLLLDDVDQLGRSGDIVKVKPGYARNFLLPQKKAIVADKRALRMQVKLQEERAKKAAVDKKEAEQQAARIEGMILKKVVKVDQDGRMYGSVSAVDLVRLLEEEGLQLERRNFVLATPIKELGVYHIPVKLKENVTASFTIKVESEYGPAPTEETAPASETEMIQEAPEEETPEDE